MTILLNISIILVSIYLQTSFLKIFNISVFYPNIVLIFIISIALFRKNYEAYAFAFCTGLLMDTISAGPYGFHIAIFMLTVFVSNLLFSEDKALVSNVAFVAFQVAIPIFFYTSLAIYIAMNSGSFPFSSVTFFLIQGAVTVVFSLAMAPFVRRLFDWEDTLDERRKVR